MTKKNLVMILTLKCYNNNYSWTTAQSVVKALKLSVVSGQTAEQSSSKFDPWLQLWPSRVCVSEAFLFSVCCATGRLHNLGCWRRGRVLCLIQPTVGRSTSESCGLREWTTAITACSWLYYYCSRNPLIWMWFKILLWHCRIVRTDGGLYSL